MTDEQIVDAMGVSGLGTGLFFALKLVARDGARRQILPFQGSQFSATRLTAWQPMRSSNIIVA